MDRIDVFYWFVYFSLLQSVVLSFTSDAMNSSHSHALVRIKDPTPMYVYHLACPSLTSYSFHANQTPISSKLEYFLHNV